MKKIECLSPAGTMEALKAAIAGGADAIYCGGTNFGARAFAGNFNHEEIIEATTYCHLHGVKLYVTMNTLLFENEFSNALKEVDFYYINSVDALIVQDLGLFYAIRHVYPEFEIHCSTQMHVHNVAGVQTMKTLGASRVVIARETPIEVVTECCKQGIEIEVFSYGALCVSYSGQCLMSSLLQGRSGNRGACAQYCRMQYDLINTDTKESIKSKGKYILSPKDLNVLDSLPALIQAGVRSLKIEGRMKRPEYVYIVTKTFREAIDAYYDGREYKVSLERLNELKLLFNREFTPGHLFHTSGESIINTYRPNHMGIQVGTVTRADKEGFHVLLENDLNQQDGLRIVGSREDLGFIANKIFLNQMLVNHAKKGQTIYFEDKRFVQVGSAVLKTTDTKLMSRLSNYEVLRKVPVGITVRAKVGELLQLVITDGINSVVVQSEEVCQAPVNAPIDKERCFEQCTKLMDTPYCCTSIEGEMDLFFLPLKQINELRRKAVEELNALRILPPTRSDKQEIPQLKKTMNSVAYWMEVNTPNQANYALENNYCVASSTTSVIKMSGDVIAIAPVVNELSSYPDDRKFIVTEVGGLLHDNGIYGSHHLNVTNSYALSFLSSLGIQCVEFSLETSEKQRNESIQSFEKREGFSPNTTYFGYGRRDLMTTKTCLINNLYRDGSKKNCSLCKMHQYALRDMHANQFPMMGDEFCIQHILESQAYIDPSFTQNEAISRFTIENEDEIKAICEKYT